MARRTTKRRAAGKRQVRKAAKQQTGAPSTEAGSRARQAQAPLGGGAETAHDSAAATSARPRLPGSRARPPASGARARSRMAGARVRRDGATGAGEDHDALLDAALALAATSGWRAVTLSAVAAAEGVPLAHVNRRFAHRGAIVQAFLKRIDTAMLEGASAADAHGGSARDRLFDTIMARFDAMAPYRAAITDLARTLPADPALALAFGPQALVSASWLMAAARLDANGPLAALRGAGVVAIFLDAFRVWLGDKTEDMAKTMAALDRNLRRAERIARLLDRPARA